MDWSTIKDINDEIEGFRFRVNDLSYDLEMFYQRTNDIFMQDEDYESDEMIRLYTLTEELRRIIDLLDQFERNLEELKS